MAGSLSSSTTSRTDTFDSPVATPLPLRITLGNTGLTILIAIAILLLLISIAWSIKRLYRLKRQQPHTDGIPLNPMGHRREASDRSGSGEPPTEFGVAANEDEDSQFGNEVQGSPVVPVGPLDTGASENPVGPIFTTPSDIAALDVAPDNEPHRTEVEGSQFGADGEGPPIGFTEMDSNETANEPTDLPPPYVAGPDVAPDNNPLRERQAISGSWHSSLFTGSGSGSGSGRATVTYTTRSSATNVNNPTMPMTTCATSTLHRHRHGGDDCPAITENLPPSNVAAPEVAPGNNPLREPQAAVGSWHDPNMGNL